MQVIPPLIVIAIVACAWYLTRQPVLFVIRYRRGVPKVIRGRPAETLVRSITEICRQSEVVSGTIRAIPNEKRIRLRFSADIPQGCQQQLRNMMLSGSVADIRLSPP